MKLFIILIVALIVGCSSTPKETVIEKVSELIDCVYDGNSEQYEKCLDEQKLFLLEQVE